MFPVIFSNIPAQTGMLLEGATAHTSEEGSSKYLSILPLLSPCMYENLYTTCIFPVHAFSTISSSSAHSICPKSFARSSNTSGYQTTSQQFLVLDLAGASAVRRTLAHKVIHLKASDPLLDVHLPARPACEVRALFLWKDDGA